MQGSVYIYIYIYICIYIYISQPNARRLFVVIVCGDFSVVDMSD